MKENSRIAETDDQKIIINFLKNLDKENKDLESIDNLFELGEIWKTSSPYTDFRKKIDKRMAKLMPGVLSNMAEELELFFCEIDEIIPIISPNSESEKMLLNKIEKTINSAEEKDWGVLFAYYVRWTNFPKERELVYLKIKIILELKNFQELISFRSKNNWSDSILNLIDQILLNSLPKILERINSPLFLLNLLKEFHYNCPVKDLVEKRLVEIFQDKFIFSVFPFEDLYHYWKLFSNKSQGQRLLKMAISDSVDWMISLSTLFEKMKEVDRIDFPIREIFYKKINILILNLKRKDSNYQVFFEIISEDIDKKIIPEELLPVFKKRAEFFLSGK